MTLLLQQKAPQFSAPAIMPDDTIQEGFSLGDSDGKYRVLFFYPFDFSFVCPTELLALDESVDAFRERDCEVVGISTDSQFSHLAWKRTPVEEGGIGPVSFPLVADLDKEISRAYGVLAGEAVALRATFIVDRRGRVRHMSVNDMDIGRNIGEILRTLDAVRRFDETGRFCPANWTVEQKKNGGSGAPKGITKNLQTFDLGD
jgi:peroxiredoxin (alkyl hydroperoxide reductase subunit C)